MKNKDLKMCITRDHDCHLCFSFQMGFSAADAVTGLKLVEAGVPKEQMALLAVPMVPLQILLPVVISKYTAGPRPLDVFYKAFPFRFLHTCTHTHAQCFTDSHKHSPSAELPCCCCCAAAGCSSGWGTLCWCGGPPASNRTEGFLFTTTLSSC